MKPEALEAARRRLPALWYSAEYEAEFIAAGTAYFHAEWIVHYRTVFEDEDRIFMLGDERVPLSVCTTFHTIDLAFAQTEAADYTVISSWAVTPKRHLILLDVVRGRIAGPDIVPKMRAAYERWGGVLLVERTSRQLSVIQEAVREGLPIRELRADKDKEARSVPAQARMEQRTVWFPPASTPWYREIEEELLVFPAGRHDDFVDTLSYAALQLAKGSVYEDRGFVSF
jgi:predicted phage terminase large subunit-like protein